jgi:hypothetical protein
MVSKRRKIPVFKVSIMPDEDYSIITEIPEVKKAVIKELVLAIKEGIKSNKKSISLFNLADSDYYIELDKEKWKQSLKRALSFYEMEEDYGKCIECRDLLNELSYETTTTKRTQ